MWYYENMNKKSGQIVVFVLLIMLLALTVGLSAMSRTLTDLKSTTISDQSSRAFTAAEAGIETALSTNLVPGDYTISGGINGIEVGYKIVPQSTGYVASVDKDDVVQVDLKDYTGGNITISWTSATTNCLAGDGGAAALEVSVYKKSSSNVYSVIKTAYNANGCTLNNQNGFSDGTPSGSGGYSSKISINPTLDGKLIRIRPVYSSAKIMVEGAPSQAYEITSKATTQNNVVRAVKVVKSKPSLPPMFDYVLFGGAGNLSQ
jgi:hypothetical protein